VASHEPPGSGDRPRVPERPTGKRRPRHGRLVAVPAARPRYQVHRRLRHHIHRRWTLGGHCPTVHRPHAHRRRTAPGGSLRQLHSDSRSSATTTYAGLSRVICRRTHKPKVTVDQIDHLRIEPPRSSGDRVFNGSTSSPCHTSGEDGCVLLHESHCTSCPAFGWVGALVYCGAGCLPPAAGEGRPRWRTGDERTLFVGDDWAGGKSSCATSRLGGATTARPGGRRGRPSLLGRCGSRRHSRIARVAGRRGA
jgi:hypothetical protein